MAYQKRWQFKVLGVGLLWALGLVMGWMGMGAVPAGATNLAKQPTAEIQVSLGNSDGALKFFPDHLNFESGQRYKLVLSNDSSQKHYFTAKDFADAIWSQKVDAGNVEIKGAIHELELRPDTEAEWVFVPVRVGSYSLRCTIPGHAEAGMVGVLEIDG